MTGTLDTFTDNLWQWQGLWNFLLNSNDNVCDSGQFNWPLVALTGILDTWTDLQWQLLGLWILVLNSSGNERDSKYLTDL